MMRTAALFICACLLIGCGHTLKQQKRGAEGDIKSYIFEKNGYRHFDPQIISAGTTTVDWIFPVPEDNAVGHLDERSNGIAFLKFGEFMAQPESKVIAKKFSNKVYGAFDYRFSPNFSDSAVAYCKTRVVVIANVKTGEAFHVNCGLPEGDYLRGIRFLDPQKNLFVLHKSINDGGTNRWKDYLHIAKLKDQKLVDTDWSMKIGETEYTSSDFPRYQKWFVHNKNLFVYNHGKILCTDGGQSVSHPFSTLFNANSDNIGRVKDIAIHPKLPFGVIIEESAPRYNIIVLRFDIADPDKKGEQVISLAKDLEPLKTLLDENRITLAYQSFSPDGNWYVAGCVIPEMPADAPQSPYFIAIPVVSGGNGRQNSLDMSNLTLLGQVKNMTSIAWTREPASYVVSDGERLRKWDLGKLPKAGVFTASEVNAVKGAVPAGAAAAGTFTDERDNKTYKTVTIGGKTWMAENLNYNTDNSRCYVDSADSCAKYGRLYDWNAAMSACPAGWHLPTSDEWGALITAAGGPSVAGRKLKAKSGWCYDRKNDEDGNGTDDHGFSALPGGHSHSHGYFLGTGYFGCWWTATEVGGKDAYHLSMDYNRYYFDEDDRKKDGGYSVRCLRDE